jgi:uncharacterized integral membrane protein (TIGR00697 family)
MDTFLLEGVEFLRLFHSELMSFLTLLVCFIVFFILFYNFGKSGLYAYQVIAVISANIQVLKMSPFSFLKEPMALGTVMFSTTFLASDMLTQLFGVKEARKSVSLSILSQIFFISSMLLTLGHKNLIPEGQFDSALDLIFTPSLRFLTGSIVAFYISQISDIWIFNFLKNITKNRHLWFRQYVSMFLSGLVDNTVFSVIVWIVLAQDPFSFSFLFHGTILGATIVRCIVNLASTPFMYFCLKVGIKQEASNQEIAQRILIKKN